MQLVCFSSHVIIVLCISTISLIFPRLQYLLEGGLARKGAVAITQPRRVAAISIAKRVAQERRVELGQEVLIN